MAGDLGSALLSLAVVAGVAFGLLAAFPRSRKGLIYGTAANLIALTLLTALGSALVGPLDLRPMLIWVPVSLSCAVIWFYWKVRPHEIS